MKPRSLVRSQDPRKEAALNSSSFQYPWVTDGPAQMSSPIEQAGMSASHEVGGRTQSMDEGDSLDGAPTVGAAFGVNTQYA